MSDFDYWDLHTGEGLTDDELHRRYDDMLDEVYGEIKFGELTFWPSGIIRELDPIAYRCGFGDFIDFELGETITDECPFDGGDAA